MTTKFRIEINDNERFVLRRDGAYIGEEAWVSDWLYYIAKEYNVPINDCQYESHALFKLNQYGRSLGFQVDVVY